MRNKKKAYLVRSQEDYNYLMEELEEEGYLWVSGQIPTIPNYYSPFIGEMCVYLTDKVISYSNMASFKKYNSDNYDLIEYRKLSYYPSWE